MLIAQSSLLLERYLLAFEEASMACITSINISARKGVRKTPVGDAPQVVLVDDGLENGTVRFRFWQKRPLRELVIWV